MLTLLVGDGDLALSNFFNDRVLVLFDGGGGGSGSGGLLGGVIASSGIDGGNIWLLRID